MTRIVPMGLAAAALLFATACTGNRVANGALVGAGVGAVAGQVISGSPVTGAVVGAAGGAVVGALDKKHRHRAGR